LWKSCIAEDAQAVKQESFIGLTAEEAMIYKRLQDKQTAASKPAAPIEKKDDKPAYSLYNAALTQITAFNA
jgi:hypothetical protein